MHKKLYIFLIAMLSGGIELVSAQIALPVFQAIQKRVASHPGFSVTALSFGNDDQNGTGGDHIEIPWGTGLKDYTIDDSSSFTVTIRAKLPVGSHWVRKQCYYTSPGHSMRAGYYYDGSNRIYSTLWASSGTVVSDQERGTVTRSTGVANHSTSWAGRHSNNIQMIYYDSEYYFWTGYRGTVNASTGVFTSSDTGTKVWFERNYSYDGTGTNKNIVYDGNDSSSPTVLAENTASGTYDYVKVSYSQVSDFSSGNTGTIVSTGLGNTAVGAGSDYGPAGAVSKNSISFYKNGVYVLTLGVTPDVSGTTSGTGYLGRLCTGGNPYVDLNNITEYAFISFCDPSDITSLHNAQGNTDLRSWAAGQGKSLGIYYSLTSSLSDGDSVIDLSGNNHNGTARGL